MNQLFAHKQGKTDKLGRIKNKVESSSASARKIIRKINQRDAFCITIKTVNYVGFSQTKTK